LQLAAGTVRLKGPARDTRARVIVKVALITIAVLLVGVGVAGGAVECYGVAGHAFLVAAVDVVSALATVALGCRVRGLVAVLAEGINFRTGSALVVRVYVGVGVAVAAPRAGLVEVAGGAVRVESGARNALRLVRIEVEIVGAVGALSYTVVYLAVGAIAQHISAGVALVVVRDVVAVLALQALLRRPLHILLANLAGLVSAGLALAVSQNSVMVALQALSCLVVRAQLALLTVVQGAKLALLRLWVQVAAVVALCARWLVLCGRGLLALSAGGEDGEQDCGSACRHSRRLCCVCGSSARARRWSGRSRRRRRRRRTRRLRSTKRSSRPCLCGRAGWS
jgi:hypothetical protein